MGKTATPKVGTDYSRTVLSKELSMHSSHTGKMKAVRPCKLLPRVYDF